MAINESAVGETGAAADAQRQSRERSSIGFPYQDLDVAITVAKGVHDAGGRSCRKEQLAARLNVEMNSGSFRGSLGTARTFGLVTYTDDAVSLTDLGFRACDSGQEAAARADAFMNVPLYKRVYQDYAGRALPPHEALQNAFVALGVPAKQAATARQTFYRSAAQANFFQHGAGRLVLPTVSSGHAQNGDAGRNSSDQGNAPDKKSSGGSGGGEGGDDAGPMQNPLLRGLIQKLPQPETSWSVEQRKKWLTLAVNIFDNIYTGAEDEAITVTVGKDSAKQ